MADDSENRGAAGGSRPDEVRPGQSGAMKSLVQVESLIQLALVLPIATVVGLLIGMGLDKSLPLWSLVCECPSLGHFLSMS